MPERVIHEVRFVETDDGFRVEVKGDKERMREMGFGPGMMGWAKHRRRHRHFHRGPRFARHFGWWWEPWWDMDDEEEAGPEGEPRGEPPAQE